jgi:hypothetical protein
VRATIKSLAIVPPELTNQPQLEKTITVLLNNLGSVGHQLAELRNQFGTGNGRSTDYVDCRRATRNLQSERQQPWRYSCTNLTKWGLPVGLSPKSTSRKLKSHLARSTDHFGFAPFRTDR